MREAYAAHSGELYDLAARSLGDSELAEEAVQEAFLRAWGEGDRFDPATRSLRTGLFAILRDVLLELARARAARSGGDVEASVELLEQSLLAWKVERAMHTIGQQHRQVLIETYYRGRPYAEVATELGVSEGTVKSRVYDGLRALKSALGEVEFES